MDYTFPESEAGEGIESKLGVDMPMAAKQTFQVLLLAKIGHWSLKWSANPQ
jgi:hypothetical protein